MSRRQAIHVHGLEHKAPIPNAAVVGGLLVSSGIAGQDPETGQYSDDLGEQVRAMFGNVRLILEAAGGSLDDVVKFTFFVLDRAYRSEIDPIWLELFPDPATRPARHTFAQTLTEPMLVQCEIIAML